MESKWWELCEGSYRQVEALLCIEDVIEEFKQVVTAQKLSCVFTWEIGYAMDCLAVLL